ncbi:RICIN domain-containing protein [Serratia liquefaciens]|uniref:RICIN domain-containing protein n=1 Tax=Serratia liquefaciens TaxID=614 RepID=UPI0005CAA45C|nr:RICIN domain-containing protein [Serratia liquefaciens]GAK26805.1 acyl-CoA synthetase [Serratia liquefaciens FK01]
MSNFTVLNFSENCYYQIVFPNSASVIDGKGESDDVYLNYGNGGDYQRWTFIKIDDCFFIKHKESGRVLDGKGGAKEVYTHEWNGSDYQKWRIVPCDENNTRIRIQHVVNNRYLTAPDTSGDSITQQEYNAEDLHQIWQAQIVYTIDNTTIPVGAPVLGAIPSTNNPENITVLTHTTTNTGNTESSTELELRYGKNNSYTIGFSETLMVGSTTTVSAGIPGGIEAAEEFTVQLTLEANQSMTKTQSNEYSVKEMVTTPPHRKVTFTGIFEVYPDMTVPFTVQARVRGVVDSVKNNYLPLTAEQFINELKRGGATCSLTKDDSSGSNYVIADIRGYILGTAVMNSTVDIKDNGPYPPESA